MTGGPDYCPTCGDSHNPWMTCATARRLRVQSRPGWCRHCEHEHATAALAGICVGCPCEWRPPGIAEPVRSLGDCQLRRPVATLPLFTDADSE